MKRFLFVIIIFLLIINVNAEEVNVDISEEVVDKIQEEGTANVIVILKDEIEKDFGAFSVPREVQVSDVVEDLDVEAENEFSVIKGFSGEVDSGDLNVLLNDERVERIEYNHPVTAFLVDSVPLINASVIHNLAINGVDLTGTGETVCVIDTGVDYTHPGLGGCFGTGCKVVGGYDFVNSDNDPMDDAGHGTHVAGIIASNDTTSKGVAPNASLAVVKVLDAAGAGFTADILSGIDWCVNNANTFGISVISMSLGTSWNATSYCDNDFQSYRDSINAAIANDIFVSVASGNGGNKTGISSPACIENATAIASTDKNDIVSSFSDRASILDLLAPGDSITSTKNGGGTEIRSGTSMAAPHVSGAVALLRQFFRLENGTTSITPNEIETNLQNDGVDINDTAGVGLIFKRIDPYLSILSMDIFAPRIDITLSDDVLELGEENLTIDVDYSDAFLDSSSANVSLPNGTLLETFVDTFNITTGNLTELGTYTIDTWANDTNGNENNVVKTFLVRDTSGAPTFVLNSFDDNYYSNNSFLEFNISIGSKYNLTNVTLNHNFTDWHSNFTYSLNLNETELIFNNTFIEGIYLWGLDACDVNNYCVNSNNKTLFVDLNEPNVDLISPSNSSTVTANPVSFVFNVSDFGVSNCSLTLNDVVNSSLGSVSLGSNNQFSSLNLGDGNYNWSVSCLDNVDKIGYSGNWTLNMACSSDWSRDCSAWSGCQANDTKYKDCYDQNYCVSGTQRIEESFSSCSDGGGSSGSSGSSSGGGGSSSTTSNSADTSVLSFQADAGDTKKFSISKDVGVDRLEIKFANTVGNVKVTVEKQASKPSSVSAVSNVYKYLKIDADVDDEDIEEAKIEFKVDRSWININAIGQSTNVFLSRYNNGKWNKLETLTSGETPDGLSQKYVAITPGFSFFAVSADKNVQVADVVVPIVATSDVGEAEVVEIVVEETEEPDESVFSFFTGGFVSTISNINSTYSLIGLGVLVLLLVLFLVLRFKKKISRSEGIKLKHPRFAKLRWLISLGVLRILKKGKGKTVGTWEDLPREKIDVKAKNEYHHNFEIEEHSKVKKKIEIKELKEKKGNFFSRLFKRKKKEEKTKPKKSFLSKLFKRKKRTAEEEPKEKKRNFISRLLKRKKKSKAEEVKEKKPKVKLGIKSEEKKSFFSKLFKRKKKEEKEVKKDKEPEKKKEDKINGEEKQEEKKVSFFGKLKEKFGGSKEKQDHDFELK